MGGGFQHPAQAAQFGRLPTEPAAHIERMNRKAQSKEIRRQNGAVDAAAG
jgi:hypothetical protein